MPNNVRIIADNAAQRATIAAAPVAAGMAASSMLSDVASKVCRSTGNSLSISLIWPTVERIGAVHLPWCNFSPSATIRARCYSDTAAATVPLIDTGVIPACPAPAVKLRGSWTAVTAASAYMYGGGTHAAAWFANTSVRRVDVDVVDINGLQGYLEVSRIFAGEWWSPVWNADYGPALSSSSTSTSFRDRAGRRRAPPSSAKCRCSSVTWTSRIAPRCGPSLRAMAPKCRSS